jgi:nitrate/nitrite-specific signal transduction histidine kinase
MAETVKLIECPRNAWQNLRELIAKFRTGVAETS